MSEKPVAGGLGGRGWRQIWGGKTVQRDASGDDLLAELIKADGFDTGCGDYDPEQWQRLVAGAAERAGVNERSRVLEVGCGAGAFLFQIQRSTQCRVAGVDYSASLIECASRYLPAGEFAVAEAVDIPFADDSFDMVFSHAVFYYFPSLDYAHRVLGKIHSTMKSGGVLCLLDMNDKTSEGSYHRERKRLSSDPENYDSRYAGLPHLFFDKHALAEELAKIGFVGTTFFPHAVPEYRNSRFRFNVLARKA